MTFISALCKCKCELNEIVCNSKQKWNYNECRCECKELNDWGSCEDDYTWNPSIFVKLMNI